MHHILQNPKYNHGRSRRKVKVAVGGGRTTSGTGYSNTVNLKN